jgi:ferritin-like metal-binding protein YciE
MNVIKETQPKSYERNSTNEPLHDLFLQELGRMHDAEKKLALALPLVAKAARSDDLKNLVEIHLKETQGHVDSIQKVAESLGEELPNLSCKAMNKLIKEVVTTLTKNLISPARDIAVIAVAQKIEHYEIAAYGTLCTWAKQLGYIHELDLLISTLRQEKTADELLTGIAQRSGSLAELIGKHVLEKVIEDVPK